MHTCFGVYCPKCVEVGSHVHICDWNYCFNDLFSFPPLVASNNVAYPEFSISNKKHFPEGYKEQKELN